MASPGLSIRLLPAFILSTISPVKAVRSASLRCPVDDLFAYSDYSANKLL